MPGELGGYMILALVGLVIVAAGVAFWLRSRPAPTSSRGAREAKAAGRFGAVEIRTRSGACDAARALEGQRFLAKNAPALPLAACTVGQCTCKFTKLSDRRTEGRRLEHGGLSSTLFLATNRRKKRDRRRAEQAPQSK